MKNLIVDFYELKNINVLTDAATDLSEFEGYAQEADNKNLNDRIYPLNVLDKAVKKVQPKIKKNKVVAYVNHPNWVLGEDLQKIGALVTDAQLIDGVVRIKGKFTTTQAASDLKALLKDGVCVGISARGHGTATYDETRKAQIMNDDYEVDGWDFVTTPAVQKAQITAYENYNKQNNEEDSTMEIKNLTELKVAYPAFVAEALKPVEDQNGKLVADNVTLANEVKAIKDALIAKEKELSDAKAALATATASVEKAKFDAAVADMLKDNKFKAYITVPASITTVADAKSYIDAETAKYEKFLADNKPAEVPATTTVPVVPAKTDAVKTEVPSIVDEYVRLATKL